MQSLFRYVAPASPCGYLPDREWSLEYELVLTLSPAEYMERMRQGWRGFGTMMFRPQCPTCNECRSLRVIVDRFKPHRSQRRCQKLNEGQLRLEVGLPSV